MAIIKHTKGSVGDATSYAHLNIFPDQFKTTKEKEADTYIKNTMDYFSNKAHSQYMRNKETFVKNYNLIKGILSKEDFYQDETVRSFEDMLEGDLDLASYVRHYSILTTPINELVGELTKRPDTYMFKAFDDESKNEELEFKTEIMQTFIMNKVRDKIMAMHGEELEDEQIEELTMKQVEDELLDYTSQAEKWANHIHTALKAEFNTKELLEEAFRDLIITARQYYLIDEDNSSTGFNVKVTNPKNTWTLSAPGKKYTSDPSGRGQGAYAGGTIEVMEISEIIEDCPELTKKEIDHLRKTMEDDTGMGGGREGNITRAGVTPGINSIEYDTHDPLVTQERMMIECEMGGEQDEIGDFIGLGSNISSNGSKFVVVKAYWVSKKLIGELIYLDEEGTPITTLVDENYKPGSIPTEISLKWGWVNQMYQGKKYGQHIYHMRPYKLLPYLPLIGTIHESKNTEATSVVDMMKPFQVMYNIAINQMYELINKEIGNVASVNIRRIPRVKDGDGQDDIDIWELEARERGIIFDDDSPENTKSPVSNTSVARNIDLTRTQEIQSRYNLAVQMKNECWELIGMSKQRMGNIAASETATGTNTAVQQSYTQTEPIYVAHEYVVGQLYQAMIDAAQFIESSKPESTISYITSEGASAFIQVTGNEIALRDLKVFATNRPEDTKMFNEIRMLSQAIIQNGGSLYEVIELYSTQSVRSLKRVFKKIRDKQEQMQEQQQQMEQQQMEQQQQQFQEAMAKEEERFMIEMENLNHQADLERLNKKEVAVIRATGFGQVEGEDKNQDGVIDSFEVSKLATQRDMAEKEHIVKLQDIKSKFILGMNKLKVDKDNQANDLAVAREHSKNRTKKK